jgi:hypothetical protein
MVVLTFGLILVTDWTYTVSYGDMVPTNIPVEATFVGFQTEGDRELSGKSMVDKHFIYVIYNVNGDNVLLQAYLGSTYPGTVILYKN